MEYANLYVVCTNLYVEYVDLYVMCEGVCGVW